MVRKNDILKHASYSSVKQVVNKTMEFPLCNWGSVTPQLGPRYIATEALLHLNGGSFTP